MRTKMVAVLGALLAVTGALTGAPAANARETRSPTFDYRIDVQLNDARNLGEGWLDDLEVYSKSSNVNLHPAQPVWDIWKGSRHWTDTSIKTTRFRATCKDKMLIEMKIWEGDRGNGDDYLGAIAHDIPTDSKWHTVRTIGGERGKDDYGQVIEDYAEFNIRISVDSATASRIGSDLRVGIGKVRFNSDDRIIVRRNGYYLGEIHGGVVYYGSRDSQPNSLLEHVKFSGVNDGDRITISRHGGVPGRASGNPLEVLLDERVP